jgi:NTE family protein
MPNRALVMSGGGSRGAFEVGAVDYLVNDLGYDFQVIAGVSTGSLNAIVLAQGAGVAGLAEQVAALKDLWFGIRSAEDIYGGRFLGKALAFVWKDSIFSPKPLREKLERHVDPERLKRSGRELRVGAVDLKSGAYRTIDQNNPFIREWTLASSSLPLLFPPVAVEGMHAVDGSVRNVTPLQEALEALKSIDQPRSEPDEMYVLLASPLEATRDSGTWTSGLKVAQRSVSILVNEVFREDLRQAVTVNEAVRFYEMIRMKLEGSVGAAEAERFLKAIPFRFRPPDYRYVRIWTVMPAIEFSEALEFDPKKIRQAFQAGREAAARAVDEGAIAAQLSGQPPRAA